MILAIDYDGVIHDINNPVPGKRMGRPMPGAEDAMEDLKQAGHKLIIHSVRGDKPKVIADWCDYYDVPYDEITNIKPQADLYIDDKALHFDSWTQVMNLLGERDD